MDEKDLSIFLAFVLVITLSCNISPEEFFLNIEKTVVEITEVAVTPPSGSGDFTLKLSYRHITFDPVTISCYYSGPDKNPMSILVVDDIGKSGFTDITRNKEFSVRGQDGKAAPGV